MVVTAMPIDLVLDRSVEVASSSSSSRSSSPPTEAEPITPADESPRPLKKKSPPRPPSRWFHDKKPEERSFMETLASRDVQPAKILDTVTQEYYDSLGPVPHESYLRQHRLVMGLAIQPLLMQWAWNYFVPSMPIHPVLVYGLHFAYALRFLFAMIRYLNGVQEQYGVFGWVDRSRDIAPDQHVERLGLGVIIFALMRTLGPIAMRYNRENVWGSLSLSIWSYPKMVAWFIALDYFFYVYHRSTHQVDGLWKVHSLHHGSKAPSVLLSILAGNTQEFLEIFLCPFLASMVVPCNMAELWLCSQYLVFTEAMGHSGARADLTNPFLVYVLAPLGLDIRLEDHDLHHRYGRGGESFGKETAVWDTLFGTRNQRLETPMSRPFWSKVKQA